MIQQKVFPHNGRLVEISTGPSSCQIQTVFDYTYCVYFFGFLIKTIEIKEMIISDAKKVFSSEKIEWVPEKED